ncbi:MAG: UvrD-helicase domain-containing protein [Acidobacteria bacterium]|nr:UvrD-helicase domain-containing protein [Acidobacteriota bacterium]
MSEPRADRLDAQLSLFPGEQAADGPITDDVASAPAAPLPAPAADFDGEARAFAIDPRNNVVLEASAGTGKTSVLVWRYINLLKAGVEPANILAITFTRKAAAEMRERIVGELRGAAERSEFDKARWVDLRDRLGEISISTIDAFCLSLLREFPLEADLDPGFDMADETEVPRLIDESLDRALRIITARARDDQDIALVLAQLGLGRARQGLALLLARRLVAWDALDRFLRKGPANLTGDMVCRRAAVALEDALRTVPGGLPAFLADGPTAHPRFQLLLRDLAKLPELERASDSELRSLLDRVAAHFLTADGTPRRSGGIRPYNTEAHYPSADAARRHRAAVYQVAPHIERVVAAFARDLNVVLARGVRQMFGVALAQYRRALDERAVLDFSDVLQRALELLRRMDEFSQSRFRLESRYHHVLVDEFQDTSRAQWELVSLLVQSWGEGMGLAANPSIFIVGDRKQSIYRFRDAEVAVMHEAGRYIEALRPGSASRRSISRSFRALPELLDFVNELFTEMSGPSPRAGDFTYTDADRFPTDAPIAAFRGPVLGLAVAEDPIVCARSVAAEIERILAEETVRDRRTGVPRQARPGDIAVLFRSRASHREFEHELEVRGIPTYVYKGLGFFDADEIKDLTALLRYLAEPQSDLRAAAFIRSRFVRLSDRGLALLAPRLAATLTDPEPPAAMSHLDPEDRRVLAHVRGRIGGWLARVDRIPPAELIEELLASTAYAFELRGGRRLQAWENLKKMRGLIRRVQNRGYATLGRIAEHIDALTAGDESNAVIEALEAVNLMTVHASKGLEFPIIFVVNLAKGASGPPHPVRVIADGYGGEPSVSVGPFVSETDELERDREKQETKRLLYVALTRARDRLYLASVLKDGVLQPGRGSLADVLPDSFRPLFANAGSAFDACSTVAWTGQSGRAFEWRICRPPATGAQRARPDAPARPSPLDDDFVPLPAPGAREHVSVTEWVADRARPDSSAPPKNPSDTVGGTLVHRLFRHGVWLDQLSGPDAEAFALQLLEPGQLALVHDPVAAVRVALDAWRRMRGRPDVAALLEGERPLYEVPFSLRSNQPGAPAVLRGSIDCLVLHEDGSVTVVEFKTGGRRPGHQLQLDVYLEAARMLFPGAAVDGRLIYVDGD